MQKRLKYMALSAFVLPGLGQLARGRRLKGGVMILLDNVFILTALYIALRSIGKLLLAGKGRPLDTEKLLAGVRVDNPYAVWVLGAFLLLWIYGVVDAALDKGEQ
jgi:hypothetical protein